jgi:cob(I)alamin adenosyltransferase
MPLKIYTRRGDHGQTDIYRGTRADRLFKHDPLFFLLGKLDETSVWLGKLAIIDLLPQKHRDYLRVLQQEIIQLSGDIQSPPELPSQITVDIMESLIDEITEQLPPLTRFILTVTSYEDGVAQTARVLAREAERLTVNYYANHPETQATAPVLSFLNRLSDYLFTLGRYLTQLTSGEEVVSNKRLIQDFIQTYYQAD